MTNFTFFRPQQPNFALTNPKSLKFDLKTPEIDEKIDFLSNSSSNFLKKPRQSQATVQQKQLPLADDE